MRSQAGIAVFAGIKSKRDFYKKTLNRIRRRRKAGEPENTAGVLNGGHGAHAGWNGRLDHTMNCKRSVKKNKNIMNFEQ
jgi:hypothetical protein